MHDYYYYSQLSDAEKRAYPVMVEGLRKGDTEITVKGLKSFDSLWNICEAIKKDQPDIFNWRYGKGHAIQKGDSDTYVFTALYRYPQPEYETVKRKIKAKSDEILSMLRQSNARSVLEKCFWLHNYFVKNCTYNDDAYKSDDYEKYCHAYNIEGFFLRGTAVCAGITKAFQYLCYQLGIDAIYASGFSWKPGTKEHGRHAWNIIRANGSAIQLDVTWDICISTDEVIRYDYFFMPDIEMIRDHQYRGYPACNIKNSNFYALTNTYFSAVDEIKGALDRLFEVRKGEQVIYFQFKMKQGWNDGDLENRVADFIRKNVNFGYRPEYHYFNELQTVFLYKFIKK